jgi:hypothetical protein
MGRRHLGWIVSACAACGGSGSSHQPDAAAQTVTVTLADTPSTPATFAFLAAYEDGTGPWQAAPPSGDTYSFAVTSATWSFAWTCVTANSREVTVYSFAVAERTSLTDQIPASCTVRVPAPVQLSGAITNAPAMGAIAVAWGDDSVGATASSYTFASGVSPGTHDLVAVHRTAPVGVPSYVVDALVVQPGFAVTATTIKAIDFATATTTTTTPITGLPSNVLVDTGVLTAGGTSVALASETTSVVGLSASQAQSGDLYAVVMAQGGSGGSVSVESFSSTPTAPAYVAPEFLAGVTFSPAPLMPYPRVATMWTAYAGAVGYTWAVQQPLSVMQCGGTSFCDVSWSAYLSPGAVGASPEFQLPDLSTIPGWNPRLALVHGTMAGVFLGAHSSTAGASDFPPALAPSPGTTRTQAHTEVQLQL